MNNSRHERVSMSEQSLTSMEIEYLAILYEYRENGYNRITTTELASKTFVTLGSISSNLKKLSTKVIDGEKLINYMKGYGVSLTETGLKTAGKVIRRRRIAECFIRHLNYDFYEIQNQIYQVSLTDDLADTIAEDYLKSAEDIRCSHGYLIPNKNGIYQFEQLNPLHLFEIEARVKIVKIPESPFYYIPKYCPAEINFIINIYNNKLIPDKILVIKSKDNKTVGIETQLGKINIQIKGLADQIYVIKEE